MAERRQARRYHWLSEGLRSFVDEPHEAIDGVAQGTIVNLTDRRAERSRRRQLDLLCDLAPDGIERELVKIAGIDTPSTAKQFMLPHLVMPTHHDVRAEDIVARRLHGNLAAAAERGPRDFAELLLVPGVGARTIRALAQVAEVVHGAPYRFSDPARFSVAHGGKDRHPFPVPLRVYDRTIQVLKAAVQKAKLGHFEELAAIKRLDQQVRRLERRVRGPSLEALFADERAGHSSTVATVYLARNRPRVSALFPQKIALRATRGLQAGKGIPLRTVPRLERAAALRFVCGKPDFPRQPRERPLAAYAAEATE
jgi:hypothetical protein